MEQSRPLKALHDVKVDDVDTILAVQRLVDGLIRREVREFHEGSDGVVYLQGGVKFPHLGNQGQGFELLDRSCAEGGGEEAGVEGVAEEGGDPGGGGAKRCRQLKYLRQDISGAGEVSGGDEFRALQQQPEEVEGSGGAVACISGIPVIAGDGEREGGGGGGEHNEGGKLWRKRCG